jgi:putative transposase
VNRWSEKTEILRGQFIPWLGVSASKFYTWSHRYGKVNEHNGWIPRDFWLEDWEKQAIIAFHGEYPLEGYRRLAFMMLDRDIVAVSPTSVWRVLSQAGLLRRWNEKPSKKGTGFAQPLGPHDHWHVDVSYINLGGDVLLLVQCVGRVQSLCRSLGYSRIHDRSRGGIDLGAGQGEVSGGQAAGYFG